MKILLAIARILVGVLFIFSGLVKANDPLGLSYKMQEFFELWGLSGLHNYTLAFSVAMIAFELIAGVAVLLGWRMKLFAWMLLVLILFFTFLTGYAVITGTPKECGCFGDCIPLTAMQSFQKDLLLLALILFLFFFRKTIRPVFKRRFSFIALLFTAGLSFAFMLYCLQHLPVVDCLPYKKGKSIFAQMQPPPGSLPDSTVITFEYLKNGKKVEFTADNFPEDFNDSLYTQPRRYDKLIRKGNAEPPMKDFSLTDINGTLLTDSILSDPGHKLLLFLREAYKPGEWKILAEGLASQAAETGIPAYLVTSIPLQNLLSQPIVELPSFRLLSCDATAIKTAARANPTLYLLKGDIILGKWSYADLDQAALQLKKITGN